MPTDNLNEQIKIVRSLFSGRDDAYGLETSSTPITVREPLTDSLLSDHLNGLKRIGAFLVKKDSKVQSACVDLDQEDKQKLERIVAALIDNSFYPYIERSKSKGYHIWTFFDEPIEAGIVRKVLFRVLKDADIEEIEIFPKQDSINSNNGLGNYVFLPLQGASVKQGRTLFLKSNLDPYENQYEQLSKVHRTKSENILSKAEEIPDEPKPDQQKQNPTIEGSVDVANYLIRYNIPFKIKKDKERTFYLLNRCLFADSHTTKDNLGDSSIIQGADGKLGYQCFHNHCQNKTWQDARQKISGEASLSKFINKPNPYLPILLNAEDLISLEISPRKMILSPWLYLQQILLIHGWRGVGKTMFTISFFDAITRGEATGPWPLVTPVPCLYIDGEMALIDIQERLRLLSSGKPPRKAPLLIYSDAQANSLGLPRANLINSQWRKDVKSLMLDNGIRLVALDNISSLAPGLDENSKKDWDPINQYLIDLRFSNITVAVLHHENKAGGQRGTSGREDNIDTSISLTRPHDYRIEDGCRFIVKFKKNRISTKDISLLQDYEFKMINNDGRNEWAWAPVRRKNQIEILRMLDESIAQMDIAQMLSVSKGFVSQVKTKALKDGHLTDKGKLTNSGLSLVNSFIEEIDDED